MNRRLSFKLGAALLCIASGCREPSGIAPALPPGVELSQIRPEREEDASEAKGEDPMRQSALPLPEEITRQEKLPAEPAPPTKPGQSITTKTGLQYKTLKPGNGPEAHKGSVVEVHYVGKLTDQSEFDSSRSHPGGKPFEFTVGEGKVILGWDEGVNGMLVGERRELTVPPQLGYGAEGKGKIPPNATLIFEIELLDVR
ncbi:MAG: hypothetical protein NVSMB14_00010 [Isosphaeraceae bacterium]